MSRKLLDDCFLHDKDRLSHAEAIATLRQRIAPVVGEETVPVGEATGRILAEPVVAPRPIPAHTNAAVDGYAFAYGDYDAAGGCTLPVAARAAAGHALAAPPPPGSAVRIFTGAAMPEGLDTVVMQEDVTARMVDGCILVDVPPGLKAGANCRKAGEDAAPGARLLEPGRRLRPQDCATAAAAGYPALRCHQRPRVAILSSGDEIVRPGAALAPGQVYDANAPMLRGLIEAAGGTCMDLGVMPDQADAVRQRLAQAARSFDMVVTSGGASRGEEDHVVKAVDALGRLHMWQIAIKPGRPMAFGQIGDCLFLGLPGNPVAVFVCFLLYVRPVLVRLGGGAWPEPMRYPLKAAFAVTRKKAGRREFWRGLLKHAPDGPAVDKFPRDGSGLISSLREADGLIEVGEEVTGVAEGDTVAFIPFSEFGLLRD